MIGPLVIGPVVIGPVVIGPVSIGTRRRLGIAVLALSLPLLTGGAATAEGLDDLPPISDRDLTGSIHSIDAAPNAIDDGRLRIDSNIKPLDSSTRDGSDTVITLRSDVLFDFGKAELTATARTKIGQLIAKAPQKAATRVYGHTDSIGSDAGNLTLSRARAKAVAAAITSARPDLALDVKGFGEKNPVAANTRADGKDDPDGRAKNRRVEIRFGS